MTLDTYTHMFEQARHGADVRGELAKSDFANLLTPLLGPRLGASAHLRSTSPASSRRLRDTATKRRHCAPTASAATCAKLE
jgi:hypothetical protein